MISMRLLTLTMLLFHSFHFSYASDSYDARLDAILEARDEDQKKRDQFRHPREMMTLFEIDKGQTIADDHGGAWYGAILFPLIGAEGHYIGAELSPNRNRDHNNKLREENDPSMADKIKTPEEVETFLKRYTEVLTGGYEKRVEWSDVQPKFTFLWQTDAPEELYGTLDRYLFFRTLHRTTIFGREVQLSLVKEAFDLLKPGGIAGVVQHRAPESHSDEWANGENGYLKQSYVIKLFTDAGFVLEEMSEINSNPKDQPRDNTEDEKGEFVWRLPPTNYQGTEETKAIGESDRMTLKFRKPL